MSDARLILSSGSLLAIALFGLTPFVGCGGPEQTLPTRESAPPQELVVEEPIAFTLTPYDPAKDGPNTIAELNDVVNKSAFVWQGIAPGFPYPVQGDCEPDRNGDQAPVTVSALPMTIEGVVTIYPRYFIKPSFCGQDERFYGSFFIQDSTGGVFVMRDSRIAPFTFGDRVRMRVVGLTKIFDYHAVMSFDQLEVVTGPQGREPIYVQPIERALRDSDQAQVMQVVGRVSSEATNNNFNEMRLRSLDDSVEWIVSLDREVGQRNPDWRLGDVLKVTGPVINSFGLKIIVMSYGQVEKIPQSAGGN